MANGKMTKREMFAQIKANYSLTNEEIAFIDHEVDLLSKKNSTEKKPTATQVANENIKKDILYVLEGKDGLSVTEIQKLLGEELSNQKVSALVRQLVAEGKVVRYEDKRKAIFKLA